MNTKLLEIRNKMKRKKPKFRRTNSNVMKQFKNWRKPRGMHNKRRLKRGGHQKNPSTGYSSPREVRGLTRGGFKPVLVCTFSDLNKIKKENIIVLSGKIGLNKKLKLLDEIKKLGLNVSNVKDIDNFIKSAKEIQDAKKLEKKSKKEKREISKKEAEKKKKEEDEKKKTEEKQKELSKEARVEERALAPTAVKEKQAPKVARATAPKSQ